MADCLFCSIVAGDIPADIVLSTPQTLAFRDIDPQAPTHVLVIPKDHHENIGALATEDPALVGSIAETAREVAEAEGIGDAYRLVFNTGAGAGQSVFHVHGHVLGGRNLSWPPG
ncbi:MAG TPA: histidine triad nucleotide-binding protein [Candidatus Nanopelagicales bacterium]|nr:histidine triad nucleotide-binding protein [Candidatus Nanopelagicales bacterium]